MSAWTTAVIATCLFAAPEPSEHPQAARGLTLAEAVELAMRAEPRLAQAELARDRSELAVLRAELDRVSVRVDAQLSEVWARSGVGGGAPRSSTLGLSNLSANASVPLFAGFRVRANIDRAEHLRAASLDDLLAERRTTAIAVARAYWAVRKVALLADVEREALVRAKGAEDIAASRVAAGLAPPIDANRARARRLQIEVTLAELEGRSAEANAELATLLGAPGPVVPTDAPRAAAELPGPREVLLAEARSRRPELRGVERRAEAQGDAVTIARSAYYPELAASGLVQVGNNPSLAGVGARGVSSTANPFADLTADVQAGLTLSVNLFDTLHTATAVEDAELEAARLGEERRRVAREIEGEVDTARAKVERHHGVLARLRPAEDLARDNVSIIQRRYENGEALVFELLDAELELLDLERRLADTSAEVELAWLELDAATGTIIGANP